MGGWKHGEKPKTLPEPPLHHSVIAAREELINAAFALVDEEVAAIREGYFPALLGRLQRAVAMYRRRKDA